MANPYQVNRIWAGPNDDQQDEPPPGQPVVPKSTTQPTGDKVQYGDPQTANGGMASPPQSAVGQPPVLSTTTADPFAMPTFDPSNREALRGAISQGLAAAHGAADPSQVDYFEQKWPELVARGQQLGDPNYAWNRLLGMDGGGLAKFGPFAGVPDRASSRSNGGMSSGSLLSGSGHAAGQGNLMTGGLGSEDARALYERLLARANQSLDLDPRTDPIMRGQTDAFDAARQRGDRNTLSSIAEKAGPNTNLEAVQRSAGEASGQATAGFQANLAQNELNARRQEIQQALTGAQGLLTSQQQMALQEELSNLDRAQQQWQYEAGLNQNESQFGRTLGQNAYQFDINDQYRNSPLSWT